MSNSTQRNRFKKLQKRVKVFYHSVTGTYKGFTLIEILLVIGIIGILAAVVITAINPRRQLGKATDLKRTAHAREIVSAIRQYQVDYGFVPNAITTTPRQICAYNAVVTTSCADIDEIVDLRYISGITRDTKETNVNFLGYNIVTDQYGRVVVTPLYSGV